MDFPPSRRNRIQCHLSEVMEKRIPHRCAEKIGPTIHSRSRFRKIFVGTFGRNFSLQVTTSHYKSLQVTTSHYKSLQVTKSQYKSLQVTTSHYKSLQVTTSQYKSLQVTTSHYKSLQVTTSHYKSLQVTTSQYFEYTLYVTCYNQQLVCYPSLPPHPSMSSVQHTDRQRLDTTRQDTPTELIKQYSTIQDYTIQHKDEPRDCSTDRCHDAHHHYPSC